MRTMARLLFIASTLLFMSCGDPLILDPVEIELSSNVMRYENDSTVTATVTVSGGSGNHTIQWLDNGVPIATTTNVATFGPYQATDRGHTITVIVMDGKAAHQDSLKVRPNISPVAFHGELHVDGVNMKNEHGEIVQLRGMSTHGLQYFENFYTENLFTSLRDDWKVDIIRVANYVNEGWPTDYLDDPATWKSRVDALVGYAVNNGLYVLIDWHMLSPGDPNYYVTEAKEFWTYMVNKHGQLDNVLFDICNEPNDEGLTDWDVDTIIIPGKTVTWSMIKTYADQILPIIRAKSDNIMIVGTPKWASRPNDVIGNKLEDQNTMYTMHFYAADHGAGYRGNVKQAVAGGIPVFVTEFGTQEASGEGTNDFEESKAWLDLLDSLNISWINWNLSNDWRSGAVYKEDKSYGSVESYSTLSNLKESGVWIFKRLQQN